MHFRQIFYGGGTTPRALRDPDTHAGTLYVVTDDGCLRYYRHESDEESGRWAAASGSVIKRDFGFQHVCSPGDGVIYAVRDDGSLVFHRDLDRTGHNGSRGVQGWSKSSGAQIATGWHDFAHVVPGYSTLFGTSYSVLYTVTHDGRLLWYRDALKNGANRYDGQTGWAPHSKSQVHAGFHCYQHVFGWDGVIYGITPDGGLFWYRDLSKDGTNGPTGQSGWAPGSGKQVGRGWHGLSAVFSGGADTIYAVQADGSLWLHRSRRGEGAQPSERDWCVSSRPLATDWFRAPATPRTWARKELGHALDARRSGCERAHRPTA